MAAVTHLSTVHPPFDNRIFHKECRTLAAAGYAVSLVAPAEGDREEGAVRVLGVPRTRSRLFRIGVLSWVGAWRALRTRARIIHIHDPELLPAALLLKWLGRTVIYDAHENVPRQILSKHWISPALRRAVASVVERVENFIAARLDAVVAANPPTGPRFAAINPRTVVINNFPWRDEIPPAASWQSRRNAACYVGALSVERGVRDMLDAVASCGVPLVLAGAFSPPELLAECEKHRGWRYVRYHGVVDRAGVREILSTCKIGLSCLHATPNYVENQPTKVFEYMSAGIPSVTSNFELWTRLVEGNRCGICVDPRDPAAIAEAMRYLLAHDEEAREMGANGRRAVESRLNWEEEERKLLALYQALSDGEPPRSTSQ